MGARNEWPITGFGSWVCSEPEHWVLAGTGMTAGDVIANLVGHEYHEGPAIIEGLEVVSRGPTLCPEGGPDEYTATVHPGTKGNFVFNTATCWLGDRARAAVGLRLAERPPGRPRPAGHRERPRPDDRLDREARPAPLERRQRSVPCAAGVMAPVDLQLLLRKPSGR